MPPEDLQPLLTGSRPIRCPNDGPGNSSARGIHDCAASSKLVVKTGALQLYIPHTCTADDSASSLFSLADVHAVAVLDIRLANQGRHGRNLVVVESAKRVYKLVPIDHGACLPRASEIAETSFEWLIWPQAKPAFSDAARASIASYLVNRGVK